MARAPCCDKVSVKKGPWSPEEDTKLKSYIEKHGTGGNWINLPGKIGLNRCGKSCRLRWLNYLRPNIKHGGFSEEEDNIICSLYISIGSRWSIIAAQLPGRTDNDIKNYWNTKLKKRLLGKPRKDPPQGRRAAAASFKQLEAQNSKTEVNGVLPEPAAKETTVQTPYWLQPSGLSTVYPNYQDQNRAPAEDHGSVRKLLLKLGGGRCGDVERSNTQSSQLGFPPSSQHLYENSLNLITSSSASSGAHPFNESPHPLTGLAGHALQATRNSGFGTELDEMFHCNTVKPAAEDLGELCGEGNMTSKSNGRSRPSQSLSWNLLSPPVYTPLVSSYQEMEQPQHQQHQQQCLLEELGHFGTQ